MEFAENQEISSDVKSQNILRIANVAAHVAGVQAHAAEGNKMQVRLEKAERAIEQERATVRELQRALHAAHLVPPN